MDKKINLKYANRNIPLGEMFGFKKRKRAICKIQVLFSILEEAINENIKKEMLVFSYKGKMYSIGYEQKKTGTSFFIGLSDSTTKEFNSINELKEADEVSVSEPVTVVQELIEGPGGDFAEVPVSSNVMLKEYLRDHKSSDYNLNMN